MGFFNRKKDNEKENMDFPTRQEFNSLNRLVNTHQEFLNNIYIFHEFKESSFTVEMRKLSYELMTFFNKVCEKHNLQYWLDYGTLLGAVRHGGFIPWDDDLDVGMLRRDYLKLVDIFQDEIDNNGLVNVDCAFKIDKHDRVSQRWFQFNFRHSNFKGKFIGIDVFPHDFIDRDLEGFEEKFYQARADFFNKRTEGLNIHEAYDFLQDELGLSLEETEFYIPAVEDVRGSMNIYKFSILRTDNLLPLQKLPFGPLELPVPSNWDDYLRHIYGTRYMEIPKKIRDHGRLNRYRKQENIMEMLREANEMFHEANVNFE